MADQNARQDLNQFPALIAHTGTAGTAETVRLVADSAGALTTTGGAAGGSNVNVFTGTQQTLGTVGTVLGIGGTVQVSGASAGTNVNIVTGTQQTLGTVGTVPGIGTLTNLGSLTNAGTVKEVTNIAGGTIGSILGIGGTVAVSGASAGTVVEVNKGTINVLAVGTVGGKAASGAAAVANPVTIAGTDAGGTVYSPLVTSSGALTVTGASAGTFVNVVTGTQQTLGTVGTVVAQGTLTNVGSITNIGTMVEVTNITNGSVLKQVVGYSAGSLTAAGTLLVSGSQQDTHYWEVNGTWVGTAFFEGQVGTSSFFGINAITPGGVIGSTTTGNGQYIVNMAGLSAERLRLTYSSGTMTWNLQQTNFYAPTAQIINGSLTNIAMLNAGTIVQASGTTTLVSSVAELVKGTVTSVGTVVGAGTLTNVGSLTNVGTIKEVANLATGTVAAVTSVGEVVKGTTTLVSTVTTVSNLTNGSVVVTSGTLGSVAAVAQVHNAGTIQAGTIQLNPVPVPTTLEFGTLGTAGGSFFATISAASGAGTKHYVSGLQIVVQSGTPDVRILAGTSIQGTGFLGGGAFPPGGGIVRDKNPVFATGTNSELVYHFVSAGTALIGVSYWKGV